MFPRVTTVKPLENYGLLVEFHDGASGVVDVSDIVGKGVFSHLTDRAAFESVYVHPESETVCWDEDLELDPVKLYADAMHVECDEVWKMAEPQRLKQ